MSVTWTLHETTAASWTMHESSDITWEVLRGVPVDGPGGGPEPATEAPLPLGLAAVVGESPLYARADHVHRLPALAELGAAAKTVVDEHALVIEQLGPRNAANGYVGTNESNLIPESLIPASIARDSEVAAVVAAAVSAAGGIPVFAHLAVPASALGGTVADGVATIAALAEVPEDAYIWLEGEPDDVDDGWYQHDGDGLFTQLIAPGFVNFPWIGRLLVTISGIGVDPGVWGVHLDMGVPFIQRESMTAEQAQELIDAAIGALDFATAGDVADALDEASELDAALAAVSAATDPAAWLRCTGDNLGAFVASNLGDLPNGIDIRATVRMRGPSGPGIWFSELVTQTHDDGEGSWDNFEWAWAFADGSVWLGDAAEAVAGKPYDYWEWTKEGGTSEAGLAVNDTGLQRDVWISARRVHDVHAGTVTVYREVPWVGLADDTTADGRHWRIMSTVLSTPDATSIDSGVTEAWSIGLRADADFAELVIHHGPGLDGSEGAYLGGPTQADLQGAGAGASEVTDSASNVWSSASGVVHRSVSARVAALEDTWSVALGLQPSIDSSGTWPGVVGSVPLPECAIGDLVEFAAVVEWTNTSGAQRRPLIQVRLGSSTVAGSVTTGTIGTGTTRQFIVTGRVHVLASPMVAFTAACENYDTLVGAAAVVEDMGAPLTLAVLAGANATGGHTARLLAMHARKVAT